MSYPLDSYLSRYIIGKLNYVLKTKTVDFSIYNKQFSSNYYKTSQNNDIICIENPKNNNSILVICTYSVLVFRLSWNDWTLDTNIICYSLTNLSAFLKDGLVLDRPSLTLFFFQPTFLTLIVFSCYKQVSSVQPYKKRTQVRQLFCSKEEVLWAYHLSLGWLYFYSVTH